MPKPPAQTLQKIPVVRDAAALKATRLELELEAVMHYGTPDQRVLYRASSLGEEEILQLVRAQLFKPFDRFARWQKITAKEIRHTQGCPPPARVADLARFETCELDEKSLNQYGWETLAEIRAAGEIAKDHHWLVRSSGMSCGLIVIEPLTHWASCPSCNAEVSRNSVKVSMVWADRTLTREYAL
jgi:hypothetical protein